MEVTFNLHFSENTHRKWEIFFPTVHRLLLELSTLLGKRLLNSQSLKVKTLKGGQVENQAYIYCSTAENLFLNFIFNSDSLTTGYWVYGLWTGLGLLYG